jgi:hypothetical protein
MVGAIDGDEKLMHVLPLAEVSMEKRKATGASPGLL